MPLIPDQARRCDDQRDAGDDAHDSRHLGVSLQACNQAAGQSGPRIRQLFLQGPLLYQAGLIPSDAVLNKIKITRTVLIYRYSTGIKNYRYGTGIKNCRYGTCIKFMGTVPELNLSKWYHCELSQFGFKIKPDPH